MQTSRYAQRCVVPPVVLSPPRLQAGAGALGAACSPQQLPGHARCAISPHRPSGPRRVGARRQRGVGGRHIGVGKTLLEECGAERARDAAAGCDHPAAVPWCRTPPRRVPCRVLGCVARGCTKLVWYLTATRIPVRARRRRLSPGGHSPVRVCGACAADRQLTPGPRLHAAACAPPASPPALPRSSSSTTRMACACPLPASVRATLTRVTMAAR